MRIKNWILITLISITFVALSQDIKSLKSEMPEESFENIYIKTISDDDQQTSFLIWVKQGVKLHRHDYHTENIYVLEGKGEMTLGDEKFVIKKGDYFSIPKGTPHALIVHSSKPIKVLSIQSPKFTGEDRIFINE